MPTPDELISYLPFFFMGALLCNCVPHLCAGLMGTTFPTPFATPRGVGHSSPFVNFLWGAFNLAVGLYLLSTNPLLLVPNPQCAAFAAGTLSLGTYLSIHFGAVRRGKDGG